MPLTPQITLTATLQDQSGQPLPKAQLIITLCGYGPTLPCIIGTSMLAQVGPVEYTLLDGTADIPLWGNDVITPAGTFYSIQLVDNKKNVVQAGIYQFTGSGTIDLSNAPQILPGPGGGITPPLQYLTSTLWQVGIGQGTNVYTLPRSVYNNQLLGLYYNGTLQIPGLHYTLTNRTITLTNWSTQAGDNLFALYVATTLT